MIEAAGPRPACSSTRSTTSTGCSCWTASDGSSAATSCGGCASGSRRPEPERRLRPAPVRGAAGARTGRSGSRARFALAVVGGAAGRERRGDHVPDRGGRTEWRPCAGDRHRPPRVDAGWPNLSRRGRRRRGGAARWRSPPAGARSTRAAAPPGGRAGEERRPGTNATSCASAARQQALGVPAVGRRAHTNIPPSGRCPGPARGSAAAPRPVQQRVAARAVGRAQPGDVRVEVDAGEVRRGRRLVDRGRAGPRPAWRPPARGAARRGRAASRSAGPARAPWRTWTPRSCGPPRPAAPRRAAAGRPSSAARRRGRPRRSTARGARRWRRARAGARAAASARSGSGRWGSCTGAAGGAAPSRPAATGVPDRGPRRRRRRARAAHRRARSTAAPRGRTAPRRAPRHRARAAPAAATSVSACWEPVRTAARRPGGGKARATQSRAAIAARNAGSPSVVEYLQRRGRGQRGGERLGQPRAIEDSGAGRPPANETTPGRAVSARISRTGELWTPARRAAGGGGGAAGAVSSAGSSTGRTIPTPGGPPGVHGAAYPVRRRTSPQMEPNERPHAAPVQPPLSPPA